MDFTWAYDMNRCDVAQSFSIHTSQSSNSTRMRRMLRPQRIQNMQMLALKFRSSHPVLCNLCRHFYLGLGAQQNITIIYNNSDPHGSIGSIISLPMSDKHVHCHSPRTPRSNTRTMAPACTSFANTVHECTWYMLTVQEYQWHFYKSILSAVCAWNQSHED